MELRQLRYFLAVAEEGRFSRAAQRLHIAAPSLSQQIRALERELRVPLFERTPEAARLTVAGVVLAERARIVLAEVDRALADVRAAGADSRERLTLRVATMADLVLGGPLRHAALAIDGIEVSVSSGRGDDAVEAVRQGRADAAVVWSRSYPQRDLAGVVLGQVVLGVVLPLGHALSGAVTVPVAALADEVLVMFPREPFAGTWDRAVDHVFPAGAAHDHVVIEPDLLNAPEAVLRAVGAGTGIAVSILGLVDHLGVEGITVRPLVPALTWDLEAVWRAPASPAVRKLVDFLVESSQDPETLVEPVRSPGDGRRDATVTA
ncbi:LysR family transcriptional regulator [Geodermatophilus nigrescens]|uniref:DNA-binding transcriptional regulator, LysR family n=1 Tax=Geodermatophilus nigrescens TaxID=1070870 RepID=A0A1M5F100_9ACTN|nr:LysR family transcriptional regulator [Geodermatophilus nigrescens]SHF85179.1 DNA-binding transcriptional regulator, LysR family [Geodermatophilus nigrescens]